MALTDKSPLEIQRECYLQIAIEERGIQEQRKSWNKYYFPKAIEINWVLNHKWFVILILGSSLPRPQYFQQFYRYPDALF